MRLLDQLFWEVRGSYGTVLILLLRLFPSDQKHSTRKCTKFIGVEYLGRIVNNLREKRFSDAVTQNQGIRHERGPIS